ncbi:hypothetical protein MTO96_010429 [Rhipicephalus appendiculatus]
MSLAEDSPGDKRMAPSTTEATRRPGSEGPPATAAESSESTAQRHQEREHPSGSGTVTAQCPESMPSDQTAFVTPGPSHRPSSAGVLTQAADVDVPSLPPQGVPVTRCASVSSMSPAQPYLSVDPRFANKDEQVRQHPEMAGVPSASVSSPGLEGSYLRRTLSRSPSGTAAAAAIAAAASYAPFVGVHAVPSAAHADAVEATTGQDTAGAADVVAGAGGVDSQLPDTSAGRPNLPRRLLRGAPFRRLFDLLSQLDCFWLAQDLHTGDKQRWQSSVRVLATIALLLLVLWLAAVPNSAEKAQHALPVGASRAVGLALRVAKLEDDLQPQRLDGRRHGY